MTTQAIDALRAIHEQMRALAGQLTDEQWASPSGCEGWRVQDVFAHVTSNMKETVDPSPPPEEPVEMKAEEAMDALVQPRLDWSPEQLLAEYDANAEGWLGAMAAMQEEPTASTVAPLADLGSHPLNMVANAFAFDHYCHLWIDMADLAADMPPATDDMVRPGIDWMIAGMPQMQPSELAQAVGQKLVLDLTGPGGGQWVIEPGSDMINVTEGDAGADDAAATIRSSAHDFVSWGTKRSDWRGACQIEGDEAAATPFLDTVNII